MKNINEYTRKDFESIPYRKEFDENIGEFDSLIILPTKKLHDSGFRCIDFIAVRSGSPICRLSGCSDVIHIDGIGGLGADWLKKYNSVPKTVPPTGWCIDCLPKSGLLRLFTHHKLTAGADLSSFEIYTILTTLK